MSDDKHEVIDLVIEGSSRYSVFYEDTDLSGYVYHPNYLKFFERAREELIGLEYVRDLYHSGLHFVVTRIAMTFSRPGKHGDLIEVTSRLHLNESPVSDVEQIAWRLGKDGARDKLVTAQIKLAAVTSLGEVAVLPPEVRGHFAGLVTAKE